MKPRTPKRLNFPAAADFRDLARLAIPVALVQVGLMAMGVVDTMIVGHLSAAALAGVAVGTVYVFALGSFGMGLLMAVEPILSQAIGAGETESVARAFQRGLVLSALLGVLGALAILPLDSVLRAFGQSEELIAVGVRYSRVQMPSMMAFYLFFLMRQCLQAQGQTRPIVITIVIANAFNAVLAWSLVFGHFGAPALGVWGAGLATTLARWVNVVLLLGLAWRELRPLFGWKAEAFQWRPMWRLMGIGLPIAVQYQLEFGVFAAVALIMGRIGQVPMAAHQIAINIASLTFMVPMGISSAGAVLVGRAVGAGDAPRARRAAIASMIAGVVFMAFSAIALGSIPRSLARAYTNDAAVIAMAASLLPIAAVFQVFDALQVVSIGVLRGVGDTRTPLIVNLLGYWVLALPLGLWLAFRAGQGPQGLWWGLVAGLATVGVVLATRVRIRLWRSLERLRVEDDPALQG
ncbi:MAG: MATE family efflux transporter [Candidatus Eisenbacteria bacterium]